MTIQIKLNGEACEVSQGTTLQDIIDQLGLTGQPLAVSVNKSIVPRRSLSQEVQAQDRIDIVHAIGAG